MPGDQFTEGGSGKDYLVAHGIPRSSLIALPTGRDTWHSMEAVAQLAHARGWDSIVIVTDPWHAYRCRQMARSLGLTATTSPVHSGPVVQHAPRSCATSRARRRPTSGGGSAAGTRLPFAVPTPPERLTYAVQSALMVDVSPRGSSQHPASDRPGSRDDGLPVSGYAPAAEERWVVEPPKSSGRTAFERDRARVLHGSRCGGSRRRRRWSSRTRATSPAPGSRTPWSVRRSGASSGAALGCDPDLVETAGLAHDLGTPAVRAQRRERRWRSSPSPAAASRETRRAFGCS